MISLNPRVLKEIVSEKVMVSSLTRWNETLLTLAPYIFSYLMTKEAMIQAIKNLTCEKKNLDT
jgi:hypothetical protein